MPKRKTKSDRLGIVEYALIVIIVGAIVILGWYVYSSLRSINTIYSSATSVSNSKTPKFIVKKKGETAPQQYLDITQWNVKIPLSSAVGDAYYVVPIGTSPDADGNPSDIALGLHSLNSSCGAISTTEAGYGTSIGGIFRDVPTATDPVSGEVITQKYPGGVTIDGYYYAYFSRNSGNSCASATIFHNVNSAFETAIKNMVSTSTQSSNQSTASYFTIQQWGVQAPNNSGLDLSYNISSSDPNTAWLNSEELASSDPSSCKESSNGNVGSIGRYLPTDPIPTDPSNGETAQQYLSQNFAASNTAEPNYAYIGGYYYIYWTGQNSCINNIDLANLVNQINDEIGEMTDNLQAVSN